MFSFFYRLNLTKKLVLIYVSVIVLAISLLTFTYYISFKNALFERTFAQLSSINMLEKQHIEELFNKAYESNIKIILDEVVKFDHMLYERTGMGETGETYIVDDDLIMRSISRFIDDLDKSHVVVDTKATKCLREGITGQDVLEDYRGVEVLSVYRYLEFENGIKWYIISEIDYEEAMIPVLKVRNTLLWIGLYVLIAVIIITIYVSKGISEPIKEMKAKVEMLASGKLQVDPLKYKGEDELGDITNAINQLIVSLNKVLDYTRGLSSGNFHISYQPLSDEDEFGMDLSLTKYRLMETLEKNKKLEFQNKKALLKGQENERIRLAKELHDSIGALLTTAKFTVSSLEGNEDEKAKLKALIDQTVQEVRAISFNIMPGVLVDFGLGAAIKALVQQVEEATNLTFNYENNLQEHERFDSEIEINVYRVFQEAINNIVKHAGAQKVELSISNYENTLIVLIEDDGSGFDSKLKVEKNSNGLRNITERIKMLQGQVNIHSNNKGTSIEAEIPLK